MLTQQTINVKDSYSNLIMNKLLLININLLENYLKFCNGRKSSYCTYIVNLYAVLLSQTLMVNYSPSNSVYVFEVTFTVVYAWLFFIKYSR